MVRKRLGRGLSALLGENPPTAPPQAASPPAPPTPAPQPPETPHGEIEIPVERIRPNPYQPRQVMDPELLEELAQSIKNHGLLEPLLVRRDPQAEGSYQLVAGERRLRAARLAGCETVPVILREDTDDEMLEIAIVENVQREDLNPIEEALGYRTLIETSGLSQQQVADKVGKSRAAVANLLRLLDLPDYVQEGIRQGRLSQGHGKLLAGLDEDLCRKAFDYVTETAASVRALERFVQANRTPAEPPKTPVASQPSPPTETEADLHLSAIEEALRERLATKVRVKRNRDGSGQVSIPFYNDEDLDRLLEELGVDLR